MKNYVICAVLFAASAIFAASCAKNANVQNIDGIAVSLSASSQNTKVAFGEKSGNVYPILWDATGESVKMIEVAGGTYATYNSATSYSLSNDAASANFSYVVTPVTSASYDYHFLSPAAAFNYTFPDYCSIGAFLPLNQSSRATSVDPAAAILFSSKTGLTAQGGDIATTFSHISAYCKMTISDLTVGAGETIQNVTFKADGKVVTGLNAYVWNTSTYAPVVGYTYDNVVVNAANLNTSTGTFDVWFSCWPFDLSAGEKFTVIVTTNTAQYRRVITLSSAKSFVAGHIAEMTINMASAEKSSPISALYMLGDACSTGWALAAQPFSNINGVFVWEGVLYAAGMFRFDTVSADWFPSLMIQDGKLTYVTTSAYDAGIHQHLTVPTDGLYQVVVDTRDFYNMSYTIQPTTLAINSLCIVGDATPSQWALGAYPMTRTDVNTFTWTGTLNPGTFRLNLVNDWFPSLMKLSDGSIVCVDAAQYNAGIHEHFSVAAAGNYTITANIANRNAMTVSIVAN